MIEINFEIKANNYIESPTYGMVFFDSAGKVCFATNTLDQEMTNKNLKKGEINTITYSIHNIFDNGEYTIAGAVASTNRSELFVRTENAASFKVIGVNKTAKASHYPKHSISIK